MNGNARRREEKNRKKKNGGQRFDAEIDEKLLKGRPMLKKIPDENRLTDEHLRKTPTKIPTATDAAAGSSSTMPRRSQQHQMCYKRSSHSSSSTTTTTSSSSTASAVAFRMTAVLLVLLAVAVCETDGAMKRICWTENEDNPTGSVQGQMMDKSKRTNCWPLVFLLVTVLLIAYPVMYVSVAHQHQLKQDSTSKEDRKKSPNEQQATEDSAVEHDSEKVLDRLATLLKAQKKQAEEGSLPKIYRPAMSNKKVRPGETIRFDIPITVQDKENPIDVIWELNGNVLKNKSDRCKIKTNPQRTIIEIRKAERRDGGQMRLTVKNQSDKREGDIAEARVSVLRVPKSPKGPVLVQHIQSDGCTFKFGPPIHEDGIPPVEEYIVEAIADGVGDPSQRPMEEVGRFPALVNPVSGMIELPVTGMVPPYQGLVRFQIRAVNSVGTSIPLSISTPINIADIPSPIGPILAENVSSDGCTLKCYPPPAGSPQAPPVQEYIVEAKAADSQRPMQEIGRYSPDVNPANGMVEFPVKGLPENMGPTEFQIRTVTAAGYSEPLRTSAPINIVAEPVKKPQPAPPVGPILAEDIGPGGCTLKCYPSPGDDIQEYIVEAKPFGSKQRMWAVGRFPVAVNPANGMIELPVKDRLLLENQGPTEFNVRSVTAGAVSDPLCTSAPINIAEPEKKPPPTPLGPILIQDIGTDSCTLKCAPPQPEEYRPVEEYVVEAKKAGNDRDEMKEVGRFPARLVSTADEVALPINGLRPNQGPTDFQIRTVNAAGASDPLCTESPARIGGIMRPSPPTGPLLVENITSAGGCTLRCDAPADNGGAPIEEYIVEGNSGENPLKEVGRFPAESDPSHVHPGEVMLAVTGLDPNHGPIMLQVRAKNTESVSDPLRMDQPVTIPPAAEKKPPAKPSPPTGPILVKDVGSDGCTLEFNPPSAVGDPNAAPIDEYIVEAKPAASDESEYKHVPQAPAVADSSATPITIQVSGLPLNQGPTNFRIRSRSKNGEVSEPLEMDDGRSVNIMTPPKPPDIVEGPTVENLRVRQGKSIQVSVPVSGFPTPRATWKLNEDPLADGVGRCQIQPLPDHAAVEIRAAELKDTGTLELKLANAAGEKTVPFTVTVIGKPDPPSGPLNTSNPEADGCELSWKPPQNNGGEPVEEYVIQAKEESDPSFKEVGRTQAQVAGDSPSYQVEGLKPGSSYLFRVRAVTKEGTSDPLESAEPIKLAEIAVGPTIDTTALMDATVNEGELIRFAVPITGRPTPSVHWTLNDSPLEDKDQNGRCSIRLANGNQAVLEIVRANPAKDAGKLTLTLKNPAGTVTGEAMIAVPAIPDIAAAPTFDTAALLDASVKEGELIHFSVPVQGRPTPSVHWTLNDSPLEDGGHDGRCSVRLENGHHAVFAIDRADPVKDSGKLVLTLKNPGGTVTGEATITVVGKPGIPAGPLTAKDVHAAGCSLIWSPPKSADGSNQPVAEYIVEAKNVDEPKAFHEVGQVLILDPAGKHWLEYKVAGLPSPGQYEFQVKAKNEAGESEPLKTEAPVDIQDAIQEPSSPGQPITTDVTPDSIALKWDPPATDGGAPIQKYIIEKQDPDSKEWIPYGETDGPNPDTTILNLQPKNRYQFRVVALNQAQKRGKPSEPMKNTRTPEIPAPDAVEPEQPGPPGKPTVNKLTSDTVGLKWDPSKTDGGSPIQRYVVEQRDPESQDWHLVVENDKTEEDVTGLKPEHSYQFRVVPVNQAGKRGKPSESDIVRTTARSKPFVVASSLEDQTRTAPEELRLEAVVGGDPSPEIHWTRNGEHVEEADGAEFYSKAPEGGGHTIIAGLVIANTKRDDGGKYEIKAVNTEGEATATAQMTVLDVPSTPVGPLHPSEMEDDGCKLTWKPPEDTGSEPVTCYEVEKKEPWGEGDHWIPVGKVEAAGPNGEVPTEMKVKGCTTTKPYDFRVIPINKVGRGAPLETDEPITISKPEITDPGAPLAVTVKKTKHRKEHAVEKDAMLRFDAPLTAKLVHNFALTNRSPIQRMGWFVQTNVPQRLEIKPRFGILDPKEKCVISVVVQPFQRRPGVPIPKKDRFTILWIKTPDPDAKEFDKDWLKDDHIISKRKNVLIHYNHPGDLHAGAKSEVSAQTEMAPIDEVPAESTALPAATSSAATPPAADADVAETAKPIEHKDEAGAGSGKQGKPKKKKKKKSASQREKKEKKKGSPDSKGKSKKKKKSPPDDKNDKPPPAGSSAPSQPDS